jgi:hypothetical protein
MTRSRSESSATTLPSLFLSYRLKLPPTIAGDGADRWCRRRRPPFVVEILRAAWRSFFWEKVPNSKLCSVPVERDASILSAVDLPDHIRFVKSD